MADTSSAEAEKENVLIRVGDCSVTLLPHLGGKIASIRIRNRELLQPPLAALRPRTRTMPFDASDASGWDECLPSVAACTVNTPAGLAEVPDHGDLWRVAWQRASAGNETSITLKGECFSLPLALERQIDLSETASGWRLRLEYKLTNTGNHATPWSWAAHPLFAVEAGDTILLPNSITTTRLEGSGGGRLGKAEDRIAWPLASLVDGDQTNLSVVQPAQSGIGDKLFAGPLAPEENWCELHRPSAGVRIRVRFDSTATPYLGLWLCYGGWPDRPGPKQNCVALEPATAPVDSLARSGPWSRTLLPGQSDSWPMFVEIEII
jgi:galactose mutarotase-like enzyme